MGCTRFGERWESGAEELMVEAYNECLEDAGVDRKDIQAAWQSTCLEQINVGRSALPLAITLRLPFVPVTRVENFCASGTEAFRGAVYAVASGAYDTCLALGVEKLKDTGYGGLPAAGSDLGSLNWLWYPNWTAPGAFAPAPAAGAAGVAGAPGAAAPGAASAASALAFLPAALLRWTTFGKCSTEVPSAQRSSSLRRSILSARVRTLRCRTNASLSLSERSTDIESSPYRTFMP